MPTFRTQPSLDLKASIRRAVASQNLGPEGEIEADYAAARTAKEMSLAEKARAEVEKIQRGETDRKDPALTAEYAGNVAGMDRPSAYRMAANLRGDLEQPGIGDVDDAAAAGIEPSAYRTAEPPGVTPTQRQAFQGALASAFANRLATGNTNAEQLAHSAERFQENSILSKASAAADAGNVAGVNLNAAGVLGKKELTPFKTNAQGVTTNEYSGKTTASAGGAAPGMLPGSTGTHLMQDTDSGAKYAVNDKTGRAWKATPDKGWQPVLMTDLPKNLQKFGAGGATQSGREAIFTQRVIQSANQASKDLHNVVQLPMTASTGVFGGRKQGPGLFDATKEVLANKMTTQEVQSYNVMSTGFQRSLAAIESAGLMPSGSLTHQMDAVLFKEGDSNLTKLHKLAQTRQIVESGMETVIENPRVSDMEKNHAKSIVDNLRKAVPFTHEDLIKLQAAQEINPNATLKDVVGKVGKTGAPAGAAASTAPAADLQTRFSADPAVKGMKLGNVVNGRAEVLDAAGKVVGHYE